MKYKFVTFLFFLQMPISLSALFVKDDLIRVAQGFTQTNKKEESLFWFMIPTKDGQRGEVLIALNEGEWWPSLESDGSANFGYVDPDVVQQQKQLFLRLPAGLYYWQSGTKGTLRNRPDKPVAIRAGGEYGTQKQGRWTSTPYETFPHPFLVADGAALTSTATSPTVSAPVVTKGTVSPISEISCVFGDLLMHADYQEQFKKKNEDTVGMLARTQRYDMIKAAFANPDLFKDKDIVALVDYDDAMKLPDLPSAIIIKSTEDLMIINGQKFSVLYTRAFQSGDVNSIGMVVIVQTKDTRKTTLGIMIVQLPQFTKGAAGDELRMEQVRKMAQIMQETLKHYPTKQWIVAGNVNMDMSDSKYSALLNAVMPLADALSFKDRWTALVDGKPAVIDTIMCSGLKVKTVVRYPITYGMLLKYDTSDSRSPYFSDHVLLSAQFVLPAVSSQ